MRFLLLLFCATTFAVAEPREVSGIYPQLAMFNDEGECGTGAVVPWAGRLWAVTYAPHKPTGSSDKLYEITPGPEQIVRPESIGGTPANRMIHRESQQLFIGPYVIDAQGAVRTIPYTTMFGRMTANARHLTDPAGKIYYATMEEGLYEVDVKTLAVTELWADEQRKAGRHADLPGYHGKGLYSGQGRVIYANNGDHAKEALSNPRIPSGALAEWDGKAEAWNLVRRNQFTEITGPGGIEGNAKPESDPVWSIGWDHRSLILMCLDGGQWHTYRLPKGSHSYDGAHGWNTEWPRIRDIGEEDLLMTMHGTFWHFPKTFSAANSAGIAPRSNYLKVIGDFCRWNDRVVFGCDDTAKSEFLNKRKAKGELAGPGQSQSNLWFVEPKQIDQLGPVIGRGAVWLDDAVKAGVPSDPFLFSGYTQRGVHLAHDSAEPVKFTFEVDALGNGEWKPLQSVAVRGYAWCEFPKTGRVAWVRVKTDRDCAKAMAFFQFGELDRRLYPGGLPPGVGDEGSPSGLLSVRGANLRTLRLAQGDACYDLDADLNLRRVDDAAGLEFVRKNFAIPRDVISADASSVLYVDEKGQRWRLPRSRAEFEPAADERICREVCTERDLFNCYGTFYELPAENAGGFAMIRPIATHYKHFKDYASYRGMLVIAGVKDTGIKSEHLVRSDDGKATLWVGAVDDLWELGPPRGVGGPWKDTEVKAGVASDPFLMTGFDDKRATLSHKSAEPVKIRLEVDFAGTGQWVTYREYDVPAGAPVELHFPRAFAAYWVRAVADRDTRATVWFQYQQDYYE
jgi:hypothetical protein